MTNIMHLKMLAVFCKDVEVKYFNSSVGNVIFINKIISGR
jgi:hypothetical protein